MDHEKHERHKRYEMILFKEECLSIQGAIFEVYSEMGYFFLGTGLSEMPEKGVLSSWHTIYCSAETKSDL